MRHRFRVVPSLCAFDVFAGWMCIALRSLAGPKRRAKTDRLDACLLRELPTQERLSEPWIAPAHILDMRAKVRLRKTHPRSLPSR
jgi:hypothetical protein